ncbi:MAG: sulfatase-like hydrolase/transferase [Planctomycetes bacterium]|nr:sulfatase-like hydrolase/transferase [Planctomycetota bacterium]
MPASPTTVLRALGALWLLDTTLASLIGASYFRGALEQAAAGTRAFAVMALVSTMAMLTLVPLLPAALAVPLRARRRLAGILAVAGGTVALLFVFLDTQIWAIFRYHINGMVLNVVTTPGGLDTFEISGSSWALLALFTVALALGRAWLWFRLLLPAAVPAPTRGRRLVPGALGALLVVVAAEKLMYAWADLVDDRQILVLARVYPLYQPLTSKRLLARLTGRVPGQRTELQVAAGLLLRYPRAQPVIAPEGPRPNILVVVIDSLRADALTEQIMPQTSRWREADARLFSDHVSGGNATRIGIFSLVYGIHGSYWPSVYAERAPPVLVTALDGLGYELRVLSTTSMQFPEFRSTAWVTMTDRVEDGFPGPAKWQKDEQVGARFADWMAERSRAGDPRPFFAFVLLDAPHQSYDWPKERSPFVPYSASLDYYKIARRPDEAQLHAIRNAYLNAVHHADQVFGGLLETLRRAGLSDDTLVVLTGDHGEEFFEHGYFGHTSNYTRVQTHVPFLMSGPGIAPGEETRPTTHVDLAPTLLELLGADPAARADWSQGENLLDPPATRERIFCGWQEAAVWVDGGVLHVPLEGHKGLVEALDPEWRPHPEGDAFIRRHGATIRRMAQDFRHFLR